MTPVQGIIHDLLEAGRDLLHELNFLDDIETETQLFDDLEPSALESVGILFATVALRELTIAIRGRYTPRHPRRWAAAVRGAAHRARYGSLARLLGCAPGRLKAQALGLREELHEVTSRALELSYDPPPPALAVVKKGPADHSAGPSTKGAPAPPKK